MSCGPGESASILYSNLEKMNLESLWMVHITIMTVQKANSSKNSWLLPENCSPHICFAKILYNLADERTVELLGTNEQYDRWKSFCILSLQVWLHIYNCNPQFQHNKVICLSIPDNLVASSYVVRRSNTIRG
jgi:hypothetical protein